jgi:hypothetical protein
MLACGWWGFAVGYDWFVGLLLSVGSIVVCEMLVWMIGLMADELVG